MHGSCLDCVSGQEEDCGGRRGTLPAPALGDPGLQKCADQGTAKETGSDTCQNGEKGARDGRTRWRTYPETMASTIEAASGRVKNLARKET